MWSVGCIFAELLLNEPLFQVQNEMELIGMIFKLLGPPTSKTWPDYSSLPLAKTITLPSPQPHLFRQKFPYLTASGLDLLMSFLTYDPEQRITADEAMKHPYFSCVVVRFSCLSVLTLSSESPLPKHPDLFSSFPSAAAGEKYVFFCPLASTLISCFRRRNPFNSPTAPRGANHIFSDVEPAGQGSP